MASSFLTHSQLNDFQKNGMLVIENFINQNDVKAMKEEINDLVDKMNPQEHKGVFSTTSRNQVKISEFQKVAYTYVQNFGLVITKP